MCAASCLSAFGVLAFGSQSLTCSAGRWAGGTGGFSGPLVCATSCPAIPAPANAETCSLVQVRFSAKAAVLNSAVKSNQLSCPAHPRQTFDGFTAQTGAGAGTELHGYVQFPSAPDAYVRGPGGLWALVDDDSGFSNNTVLSADSGDRAGLPAETSTVLLFQSAPAWTASQTSATIAASGVTISASVLVQSVAGGGAGLVWAVSPTTGGALQYYELLLSPTADGLATSGTFFLAYVVNNSVTQVSVLQTECCDPSSLVHYDYTNRWRRALRPASRFQIGQPSRSPGAGRRPSSASMVP